MELGTQQSQQLQTGGRLAYTGPGTGVVSRYYTVGMESSQKTDRGSSAHVNIVPRTIASFG